MALSDKKVLIIIPFRDFEDREYLIPRRILEARGIEVKVASSRMGEARGIKGLRVKPDVLLEEVKSYDYDAFIFVGGKGVREYQEDEKVLKLIKDVDHKILGGFSTAVTLLANAGVLKGKRVTADRSIAGLVTSREAAFTGRPLEVDEKVITATGGRWAEHFTNALLDKLRGED